MNMDVVNHKIVKNKIGLLNLAQELGDVSNELRKKGIFVSPSGVRSIWLRQV